MSNTETELQKEFELERMILFSDAVFAIVITLLIIEIKFPEVAKGASSAEILHAFKPVIIRFLGFVLTFFFTGIMWARHLRIFRFLKTYNNGLIIRNLVMLFFIVCFPFSASGITEHIRPGYFLPLYIYLVNLTCVTISNFVMSSYIFKTKKELLTNPGFEVEKKYLFAAKQVFSNHIICNNNCYDSTFSRSSGVHINWVLYFAAHDGVCKKIPEKV